MAEASRLLRRRQVQDLTGLSRSTLYMMIADHRFPPPVKLSKRAVAWHATEVEAWIASRPSARAPEEATQ